MGKLVRDHRKEEANGGEKAHRPVRLRALVGDGSREIGVDENEQQGEECQYCRWLGADGDTTKSREGQCSRHSYASVCRHGSALLYFEHEELPPCFNRAGYLGALPPDTPLSPYNAA